MMNSFGVPRVKLNDNYIGFWNYPSYLIGETIYKCLRLNQSDRTVNNQNPTSNDIDETVSKKCIKVPFHQHLAPQIKRAFKDIRAYLPFYKVATVGNFFGHVKDKIDILKRSSLVYE